MKKKVKRIIAWAGVCNGHIDIRHSRYDETLYMVFPAKREAKAYYEDVRKVSIEEVKE